jgi:hypothetical protein
MRLELEFRVASTFKSRQTQRQSQNSRKQLQLDVESSIKLKGENATNNAVLWTVYCVVSSSPKAPSKLAGMEPISTPAEKVLIYSTLPDRDNSST